MKRFLLTIILAAPLLIGGCSEKTGPGQTEVQRMTITGVETAVAGFKTFPESIEAAGTVKAAAIGVVSTKVMGTVTSVLVSEGQRVKKGQTLLTIEDSDIAQKVKAAESSIKEASFALEGARKHSELTEATYQRYARLFEANAISRQEFENMTLQRDTAALNLSAMEESLKRAKAGAEEARVYRGYAKVVSPFSGVVSEKKIERGSMAAPGTPLIVIEDDSAFVLETTLDGRHAGLVKPGAEITAIINDNKYQAKVIEVIPSIDAATRTFLIKASIKGEGLRTGLYAKVTVQGAERKALVVPSRAVVTKGQLTGVYTVDEKNVASYTLVRTGGAYGDDIEVISGLKEGDRVISKGAEAAFDGGFLGGVK
ncbi:Macrolide export protein MacA [uncultured bacterium]|nr:Macrolide export protein MacA [uncultured bacterium]